MDTVRALVAFAAWQIAILPYIAAVSTGAGLILFSVAWYFVLQDWSSAVVLRQAQQAHGSDDAHTRR